MGLCSCPGRDGLSTLPHCGAGPAALLPRAPIPPLPPTRSLNAAARREVIVHQPLAIKPVLLSWKSLNSPATVPCTHLLRWLCHLCSGLISCNLCPWGSYGTGKDGAQIRGLVPSTINVLGEGNDSCTAKCCGRAIHLPPPSQATPKPCVPTRPGG